MDLIFLLPAPVTDTVADPVTVYSIFLLTKESPLCTVYFDAPSVEAVFTSITVTVTVANAPLSDATAVIVAVPGRSPVTVIPFKAITLLSLTR